MSRRNNLEPMMSTHLESHTVAIIVKFIRQQYYRKLPQCFIDHLKSYASCREMPLLGNAIFMSHLDPQSCKKYSLNQSSLHLLNIQLITHLPATQRYMNSTSLHQLHSITIRLKKSHLSSISTPLILSPLSNLDLHL